MKGNRRAARCPGCGRIVVMDDATRELRHDHPICAIFQAKMAELGMKPRHDPWVAVVADDGGVKKPGKT